VWKIIWKKHPGGNPIKEVSSLKIIIKL